MTAPGVTFEARTLDALTPHEAHAVFRLRVEVFHVEQGITSEGELDDVDTVATHILGLAPQGDLVATARWHETPDGVKVGRVAVARAWRGRGVGTALMGFVASQLAARSAWLSAQAHLEGWYARLGWRPVGGTYDEVGIPHVRMVRADSAAPEASRGARP